MSKGKMKTYRSPKLGLIINGEPEGPRVEFVNGEFKTKDRREQKLIEGNRGFGLWIFEDEQMTQKTDKVEGAVSEAIDIDSLDP